MDRMRTDVLGQLVSSPRVYDASYLPSILIPDPKTVPHLREAAARYQADLLLVYRSYCRSFERYRLFAADRSKAYCGVEAVLLDTRTGLVPFTSVALESYEVTENETDINFRETVLKAQLSATADALAGVVGEIVTIWLRTESLMPDTTLHSPTRTVAIAFVSMMTGGARVVFSHQKPGVLSI